MLILKIKEKGLYLEIPGSKPTRTPADIDITKCDMGIVSMYLKRAGIINYEISSSTERKPLFQKQKPEVKGEPQKDNTNVNQRFKKIENMVTELVNDKNRVNNDLNSEQITNKLDKLESLTRKLLDKKPEVVHVEKSSGKYKKEPKIEELDAFIPDIDISDMKMKSGSKQTIEQDSSDIDDSVDLLSRIMGREE